MKISIVGPGALGTLLAVNLARHKNEVCLIDNSAERAKRLSETGLRVEGAGGNIRQKIKVKADARDVRDSAAVFLCVKSYDTENAITYVKDSLKSDAYVISLQDGAGNLQLISEYIEPDRVIGGVTSQCAAPVGEGGVRHLLKGETIIGQKNGKVLGGIREISSMLNKANFPTKVTKDINSVIWSRLIIDSGVNATSAVTRLRNGMLVKNDFTRELMRRTVSEAVKVAKRKRIKLSYDDPIQKAESVCRANPDTISPMLKDVLEQKQTEIDYINGTIIRQGKSLAIKTPTNEMLLELVKAIETNYPNSVR